MLAFTAAGMKVHIHCVCFCLDTCIFKIYVHDKLYHILYMERHRCLIMRFMHYMGW